MQRVKSLKEADNWGLSAGNSRSWYNKCSIANG